MAHSFEFKVKNREKMGTRDAKRLRRKQKQVPAIIYGAKQPEEYITLSHNDVIVALSNEAVYSHILTLKFDNSKTEKVVLKDIQRDPGSQVKLLHLDFLRISAKEKLTMVVPLHFLNQETAPGVKTQGGTVSHLMNEIEISCLPYDLPEYIEVDIGQLQLNESVHISQITLPKGVTLATPIQDETHDLPVVTIFMPKIEKEPEPEAAPEEATTDTASENEKKSDTETDKQATSSDKKSE